jgi:hypothetical protein
LDNSRQFVIIGDQESDMWSHSVGTGQGHVLSPPIYNIGTTSQYYWTQSLSTLYGYADDGGDVISASSKAECNRKIREVMAARLKWYSLSGMAINISKTTLMGVGFQPDPLVIDNTVIEPVSSLTFLGMTLQSNFSLDIHVKSVCTKIRQAAANIRVEGRNFCTSDRKLLYMGWVQGVLCSNGPAYLPLLTLDQLDSLQTACNSAIRSVANLPRKSVDISISSVRQTLKIQSVSALANKLITMHAWKNRKILMPKETAGPNTRSRSRGNIPQPIQKGVLGKMISTLAKCAFNRIPLHIKLEDNANVAKRFFSKMCI